MLRLIKNIIFAITISLSLSGCTIFGNFYLVNYSDSIIDVTINTSSMYEVIPEDYVLKVDDINDKRIKFSTANKMNKRLIKYDSIVKQFRFSLVPNEFAYVGSGPNMRLFNVQDITIKQEETTTPIHGYRYGEFEIRRSGLFKYVGIREFK